MSHIPGEARIDMIVERECQNPECKEIYFGSRRSKWCSTCKINLKNKRARASMAKNDIIDL
jgi:hypothetical protein